MSHYGLGTLKKEENMALACSFDYQRPSTLIEALQLKAKYKDKPFSGRWNDLIVNIKKNAET